MTKALKYLLYARLALIGLQVAAMAVLLAVWGFLESVNRAFDLVYGVLH